MRASRIVDLSVAIDAETVVYPGDPSPRFEPFCTIEQDGFNVIQVHMGSQTGTHVDAPFHFEPAGARIDELDLALFAGPAVVVDATGRAPREAITWDAFEPVADQLGEGVIVLLHTGWSAHYGKPAYFEHPYLEAEACRRMLATGVRTVFLDAINIDETPDAQHPGVGYPCHHLIGTVGGIIGENFRGFEQVTWSQPYVVAAPIKLTGADGAPVRAVALEWAP